MELIFDDAGTSRLVVALVSLLVRRQSEIKLDLLVNEVMLAIWLS